VKISTVLDHIDGGSMALPEFQRGYVWNREQVRGLMDSMYRKHPVGSLLVWVTSTDNADTRGDTPLPPGSVKLLLDGQQRITSLYGIIRGRPPEFFDGNDKSFTGLYFNLDEEVFEFYAPVKMQGDPRWIDVTKFMQAGVGPYIKQLNQDETLSERLSEYIDRLNAVAQIREIDLHVEEVTGQDKTVDIVVDIFNRVNSGGTKLSKGDLALARICAQWPAARDEMQARLRKYREAGFHFKLDWLLRNVNTVSTGEALFSALKDISTEDFRTALVRTEKHIDAMLNMISSRLGLDHDRVLGSRYSFPLLARYLEQRNGRLADQKERDRLMYWYVHSMLWGRYAGSTESVLNQDLARIEENEGALDRLIEQLRQNRGDLTIHADDFLGWSRGARFYPLMYMLTRVWKACDWETGVELSAHMLGKLSGLQLHHIFPKAKLYKAGYSRPEVNALANFTFLTQETNLLVSDRDPADYLPEYAKKNPGVLESHWIPGDPELWKIENYSAFLTARRQLLAAAANSFLESLYGGQVQRPETPRKPITGAGAVPVPGGVESDEELDLLNEVNVWITSHGLPEGELMFELVDNSTASVLAILDLAWPDGIQEGLSHPVAVLIDEGDDTEEQANAAGYRYFTDVSEFKDYVIREILALGPEATAA
jgi:hypothetical protein